MFLTLMGVLLIGSTVTYSFAHQTTRNCSETYRVGEKESEYYDIKGSEKVVCFRANSGRVHLQVTCDDDYYAMFKCCETTDFDVYDGCNGTAKMARRISRCKKRRVCWRYWWMTWSSEKTSCLKLVLRKNSRHNKVFLYSGAKVHHQVFRLYRCHDFFPDEKVPGRYKPDRDNKRTPTATKKTFKATTKTTKKTRKVTTKTTKNTRKVTTKTTKKTRKATPTKQIFLSFAKEKEEFHFKELHGDINFTREADVYYPSNVAYTYKIELPDENKRIQLIFRRVDLPERRNDGKCEPDYIALYDGLVTWARVEEKFCGSEFTNKPFISRSSKLRVEFVANLKDGGNEGFEVTYDAYRPPTERHYTDNKVTGVVIGTACGLVFLALTFLAICHSRRLTCLRLVRTHDPELSYSRDAIQKEAPPSYDDVMSSPEKYPVSPSSKRASEELPPYPGLLSQEERVDNVQRSDDEKEMPTGVERVERTHEIEANDVNESEDRDVAEMDVGAESDVRESDVSGSDVRESDVSGSDVRESDVCGSDVRESDVCGSDVRESDVCGSDVRESDVKENNKSVDVRKESDASENDVRSNGSYARVEVFVSQPSLDVNKSRVKKDRLDPVPPENYSQEITTDV